MQTTIKKYCIHLGTIEFPVSGDDVHLTELEFRRRVLYSNNGKPTDSIVFESDDRDEAFEAFEAQKSHCESYKQNGFLSSTIFCTYCYIEAKAYNAFGEPLGSLSVTDFYACPYDD